MAKPRVSSADRRKAYDEAKKDRGSPSLGKSLPASSEKPASEQEKKPADAPSPAQKTEPPSKRSAQSSTASSAGTPTATKSVKGKGDK